MLITSEIFKAYLDKTVAELEKDAMAKSQKIPVSSFRVEVSESGAQLWAAGYFKYLILGRRPGKQPPVDAMLKFVDENPEVLQEAKQTFKNITREGLAYLIGRKIAREGTSIYQGKKPGIDLLGSMEANMPDLLKVLARNEATKILTSLKSAI